MDELQRAVRRSLEDLKIKWITSTKSWNKTHLWCAAVIVLQFFLWITMLLSDQPRAVLEPQCDRAQLLAEVDSLKEQLGNMTKEMEKGKMESDRELAATNRILRKTKMALEKATKGSNDLLTQLAAANQSLGETQERWKSCQAQLDSTKGKTASLEKERNNLQQEKQKLQGKIDGLVQQLSSRERELESWRNNQQWVQNQMREERQNYQQQNVAFDITKSPWLMAVVFFFLLLVCVVHLCQ
ncbi:Hypothetical predicted protein [Podarcis lilfordi]|uniref:Uncharacterized protein n=1 Tax=Podarcis lilfordi TaxID=74358 RepID=A0AA35LMS2_9SAUR|nr:Hypothetical predicted protein [Podarcis lilfordi]